MIIMNFSTFLKVSLCLILIIPIFGAFSSSEDKEVKCLESERLALVKFKVELVDDYGRLSTWGNEGDCCKWEGILCDNQTNHVITVDLQGIKYPNTFAPLRGKISPSLLELAHLNHLDLSYNDFNQSRIPDFIGSLENLHRLSLHSSNFSGLIPHSLGNLSMLRRLDLSSNSLLDTNLDWLSWIRSLEYLDLSYNDFNESRIPDFIGSLGNLQYLSLHSSNFTGLIPHSLGNLSMLRHLDLSSNSLLDTNLDWLSWIRSLEYLDLSYNDFNQSRIPDFIGSLENLHHLSLPSSNFTGLIPHALGNLSMLLYLDLSNNNLQGRIPDALGNLISLSYLSLSFNNLEGSIPGALWNLTGLSCLDVSHNQLQGEFPQPSETLKQGNLSLPNLEFLDLSGNKFTGRLPNLSLCLSLRWLWLGYNMFNGTFPKTIGSLSNLVRLDLRSNHLEGLISEVHLCNLSNLDFLGLSYNSNLTVRISPSWNPPFQLGVLLLAQCNLGPYFPTWLKKHKQLHTLDISSAKISDTIPDWFGDSFPECEVLNASNNQIYGVLPNSISILKLHSVDFSSNKLNGTFPLLSPTISHIDLSRNNFSGTIANFCINGTLTFLDISHNAFSTEISQDCFLQLTSLYYLNLANNNFSGKMPNSIDWACNVYSLHLRNNNLTGEISSSLKFCSNLNILDLGGNKFTGKIPDWLGESMPELGVLSLTSNKFYGNLPSSLCHLTRLRVLDISMNKISGPIPKCLTDFTFLSSKLDSNIIDNRFYDFGRARIYDGASIMWKGKEAEYVNTLRFLTFIDLSSNNLIGEIPPEVTSLVGLIALNLSRNKLVGSIPHNIGKLEFLNFLDLSKNNLSGHIPRTLSQLSHLGVLDLSFNNLSGKIPWDAHLQTFNDSTFIGNSELCGPPLVSKPCPKDGSPKTPPEFANNLEHEDIFISMGFYISMVFGFIVTFWGVVLTVFLNKWCRIVFHKMVMSIIDWLYNKGFFS